MNRKIIKAEFLMLRNFALAWSSVIAGLFFLYALFYPGIKDQLNNFIDVLSNFPDEMLTFFGGREMLAHLHSFAGYYTMISQIIFICGGIMSCTLGLTLMNREFKHKTIEFIATRPLSRNALLTNKLVTGISIIVGFNLLYFLITLSTGLVIDGSGSALIILLNSLSFLFIQLLFLFTGFLISIAFHRLFAPLPISLGLVFFSLFIGKILGEKAFVFKLISYYQYFDSVKILTNSRLEWPFIVLFAALSSVLICGSYLLYNRKDLT